MLQLWHARYLLLLKVAVTFQLFLALGLVFLDFLWRYLLWQLQWFIYYCKMGFRWFIWYCKRGWYHLDFFVRYLLWRWHWFIYLCRLWCVVLLKIYVPYYMLSLLLGWRLALHGAEDWDDEMDDWWSQYEYNMWLESHGMLPTVPG